MESDIAAKEEIIIRAYKKEDREAIRKICCDTAFMGQPMEIFFDDREILADIFTLYYTDYEPESTFVADFKGNVVGYLIGCKDTTTKEKVFSRFILPKILITFIKKGLIFKKKTLRFFFHAIKSLLKGEFQKSKIPKDYPADLHINVDENFRRFGLGTKLMDAFFEYLRKNRIPGIHLATFSEQGRNFFLKTGFTLLGEQETSQWRYLINRDVKTSTFGKLLKEG
jgi:GNAT superfamily N-acetyltransferase